MRPTLSACFPACARSPPPTQTESGDLNYGAMFLLALCSGLLATLLGDGGPMVNVVPDLTLLQGLRYLVYFQHMLLLPMWVFVVFRFFLLI